MNLKKKRAFLNKLRKNQLKVKIFVKKDVITLKY